ncbi:MAG: hypothetical protein WAQ33_17045 [Gaiellaceae bacterium]
MATATRTRRTTALVPAPAARIDLARWLRGITTDEYVGFTPRSGAHRSHTVIDDGSRFVIESVESIGGTMLRHRYVAEVLEPHRTVCVSPESRGRFLSAVPVLFRTTWELNVAPRDEDTSTLDCRIEVEYRARIWLLLSILTGTPLWLRRHSREETPRMAESIATDARQR